MKSQYLFRITLLAPVALALTVGSAGSANGQPPLTETIAMHALNDSGQNGTATITDKGGKVFIAVNLIGEPSSASEPAHVHFGRCPTIKAIPAYNVGPILQGKATSDVFLTWAEINSGKYALNVHKSSDAMGTYMSCGNIGVSAKPLVLPTDETPY